MDWLLVAGPFQRQQEVRPSSRTSRFGVRASAFFRISSFGLRIFRREVSRLPVCKCTCLASKLIVLNPKAESPKAEGISKSEVRRMRAMRVEIRSLVFGLLSDFVIRISGFSSRMTRRPVQSTNPLLQHSNTPLLTLPWSNTSGIRLLSGTMQVEVLPAAPITLPGSVKVAWRPVKPFGVGASPTLAANLWKAGRYKLAAPVSKTGSVRNGGGRATHAFRHFNHQTRRAHHDNHIRAEVAASEAEKAHPAEIQNSQ